MANAPTCKTAMTLPSLELQLKLRTNSIQYNDDALL